MTDFNANKKSDDNRINGTANERNGATLSAAELYRRGRALAFGLDGVQIDAPQGLRLLHQAAKAGSLDAQAEFAEAVFDGRQGAKKDERRGVELAEKPAKAGNPFALFVLGNAAADGRGGRKRDEGAAETFYRRALEAVRKRADDGDARAWEALLPFEFLISAVRFL